MHRQIKAQLQLDQLILTSKKLMKRLRNASARWFSPDQESM